MATAKKLPSGLWRCQVYFPRGNTSEGWSIKTHIQIIHMFYSRSYHKTQMRADGCILGRQQGNQFQLLHILWSRHELVYPLQRECPISSDDYGLQMHYKTLCTTFHAIFCPMLRGEIRTLYTGNIQGAFVHVHRNMVQTTDNTCIEEEPNPYTGNRYIDFPNFVANKFKGEESRIAELNPNQIIDNFKYILKKPDCPTFDFTISDITRQVSSML